MIGSYLIYHLVFFVSIVLLLPFRIGNYITLNRGIDVRYFGVFLIVILLCSLRYNVGTDYIMYENVFYKINKDIPTLMEYGYYSLNKLFGGFTNGYLYVFAVSAIVTHFFFFKVLYRESIIFWGVFYFFTFGFIFQYLLKKLLCLSPNTVHMQVAILNLQFPPVQQIFCML
jgi:hypothetical protein